MGSSTKALSEIILPWLLSCSVLGEGEGQRGRAVQ